MREFSCLLSTLEIDDQPLACEHAVLIRESSCGAPHDWAISILGARPGDCARLSAARRITATASQGQRYSGEVRADPGGSPWHVHLRGWGSLHTSGPRSAPRLQAEGGDAA